MQVSALGFLLAAFLAVVTTVQTGQELVHFKIKDQFGTVYTDEPYREGVFVLVGSDREGSAFSADWSRAILESLDTLPDTTEVSLAGLAHMNGVPRLLRGLVKSQFPRQPGSWVLLDWKGIFEQAYGYQRENTTVLVFVDGVLVHRTHGREVDSAAIEAIRAAIEASLRPEPLEPSEPMAPADAWASSASGPDSR